MWQQLEAMPLIDVGKVQQPASISRRLKPFQLEGVAWMMEMEKTKWKGGLLGDEMGLGKTIQAVSLIMSDFPAGTPSLVLVPPVALMQWQSEIESYTDGRLKTFIYHNSNAKCKNITVKDLKMYDVIMMSYNSLESMYRKQEKGFSRKNHIIKESSIMHKIKFHRVILDEAHSIKVRTPIDRPEPKKKQVPLLDIIFLFLLTWSGLVESHHHDGQGLLCPQGRVSLVSDWHAAPEPYRRVLFARQVSQHSAVCIVPLQAVSLRDARLDG
jgi:hypothetical protein